MSSLDAARRDLAGVAGKMLTICEDPTLSDRTKTAHLDRLQPQLDAAQERVTGLETVAARRRKLFGGTDPGSRVQFSSARSATGVANVPLAVDTNTAHELWTAARDGMPLITKAAIDSGDVGPASYPGQFFPPIPAGREPTRILDLVPQTGTDRPGEWIYPTTGTAAAAPVAEGAEKPESVLVLDKQLISATKIAHRASVTEEALSDFPAFQRFLSEDMIAALINAENRELLTATGVPPSMFYGILNVTGTQDYTRSAGETILDAIESAITQLRASGRYTEPDAIILRPQDYSAARRTKSTTDTYVAGDPTQAGPATLWGYPVVLTSQMPADTAVVGNFARSTQAWIRQAPMIKVNPFGEGFRSNVVEMIAEERITFGVPAPAGLCVVNLVPTP